MSELLKVIDWLKENWFKWYSLLVSLPATALVTLKISGYFIEAASKTYHVLTVAISVAFVFAIWFYSRMYPKRQKDKIGIAVALRENTETATIIKQDVIDKFREVITELPSGHDIELIVLNDFHAKKVVDEESARLVSNKTQCQFVVWGKALNYNTQYKFDLHYIVRHRDLHPKEKQQVKRGFAESTVDKNWEFLEDDVFVGIETTAANIREIAWYVMGIASQLSFDFDFAKKLHLDLYNSLRNDEEKRKTLSPVFQRLPMWLADSYSVLGLNKYYAGDIETALQLTDEGLKYQPQHYPSLLHKALYVLLLGDLSESKKLIKQIRKQNTKKNLSDSAWRYSEAFLVTLEGDIQRGMKLYKKAFNGHTSQQTIDGVIDFIKQYMESNSDRIEFQYVLGQIYLKMKNNPPEALKYFEGFVDASHGREDLAQLRTEAEHKIEELKKYMGIN